MGRAIGIDLGTTFSAVAYLNGKNPEIIKQKNNKKTIPSVVSFDGEEVIVGENALKQEHASSIIRGIKRKMGTDHVVVRNGMEYTPEQISAFILKEIKTRAEEDLGEEIKDAVITVPAYFNDNQRQATRNAGTIAGFNVLRIINEPTAASLAYGIRPEDDKNIVVFDLGGGTFDVSVLNVAEGIFEVVSTAGDNHLGGEDFNKRIEDLVTAKFKDETGIDLSTDPLAMSKIYTEVERAKRSLSKKTTERIQIPFITADENGTHDIDFEINREEFEKLIADYIDRTLELTQQAVKEGHMEISEIDHIVLVGGSTRIPAIRQRVKALFGRKTDHNINPDEVVAMGAAIQGGIIQGDVKGIVLVDVTPISLGIEVENGYFVPIIERNSPIPTSAKRIFTTVAENQRSVDVHILQGESMYSKNNISLGRFRLEGIRPAQKGDPKIEVTFELDVNGILNVTATDMDSENAQGITIINDSRMSEEEVEKLKNLHSETYSDEIKMRKKLTIVLKMKTRAESIATRIKNAIPPAYRDGLIHDELQELLERATEAVESLSVDQMESAIEGLEFIQNELKAGHYSNSERIA